MSLVIVSCQKDDTILSISSDIQPNNYEDFQANYYPNLPHYLNRFFTQEYANGINSELKPIIQSRSRSRLVEAAALNLFIQNQQKNFIYYIIGSVGYPVWESAFIDATNKTISIPFIDAKNNYTKAFLIGQASQDLKNFHFTLFERRLLDLNLPLHSDEIGRIEITVAHDNEMFENPDSSLIDILKAHNGNVTEIHADSRTIHTQICDCVSRPFHDGITVETRDCGPNAHWDCWWVTSPCSSGNNSDNNGDNDSSTCLRCDGGNVPPNIAGGGGNGPLNPPFIDQIELLQATCLLNNEDFEDIGTDPEGNTIEGLDEETRDMCEAWNKYKEKCLFEDFKDVQPLLQPIYLDPGYASNPYYLWAKFLSENPSQFNNVIDAGFGCVKTEEIDDIECTNNNYESFIISYEIELTEQEEKAIKSLGCIDNFEEEALLHSVNNFNFPNPILLDLITKYIKLKWNNRDSPYNNANECELELMKEYPLCAASIGANWITANLLTKYYMGVNTQDECSDAFRHTFFNAYNAALCGSVDIAREFGEAHECETDSEKAKTMDLHNNEIGYTLIEENPNIFDLLQTDDPFLAQQGINQLVGNICDSLEDGEMLIFLNPDGEDPDNDDSNILINSNSCSCIN